jgi:XTP/dITP diphosphohydrolase
MSTRGRYKETLVVATSNRGKLGELVALLAGMPLEVLAAGDLLPHAPPVAEDGATFADNAIKKARVVAAATLCITLADDSGLEVDLLDGRPGVRSARFAHDRATDAENNAALLGALGFDTRRAGDLGDLEGGAGKTIAARFRCVLALVDPFTAGGEPQTVEGVCEGTITRTPRGAGGFGYDPLFVVEGTDRTMAELSDADKNQVSHRGRALAALRPALERILAARAEQAARVP